MWHAVNSTWYGEGIKSVMSMDLQDATRYLSDATRQSIWRWAAEGHGEWSQFLSYELGGLPTLTSLYTLLAGAGPGGFRVGQWLEMWNSLKTAVANDTVQAENLLRDSRNEIILLRKKEKALIDLGEG